MTQSGSSTNDVAAAVNAAPHTLRDLTDEDKERLEKADELVSDRICERLNEEMHFAGEYSSATRDLLRRAWTIAAQLQHEWVTADHIIIGMVTGDYSSGEPIEGFAG